MSHDLALVTTRRHGILEAEPSLDRAILQGTESCSLRRLQQPEATPDILTQLIEQSGSPGWLAVLEADLDPWLLKQFEDLADALEIWRK